MPQQILFDPLVIPYDAVKFLLSGRKDWRGMFASEADDTMGDALTRASSISASRPRDNSSSKNTLPLLEALIDRVRDCERVFDLTHLARNGPDTEDIVFIDDLSDVLIINKSINEESADTISMALAARYSAMLKAALHVLLQIRQLHCDADAYRLQRLPGKD